MSRVLTLPYDTTFSPAMSVLEVELRSTPGTEPRSLIALVDSGADATMVPLSELRALGCRKVGRRQVLGVAGVLLLADVYRVQLMVTDTSLGALNVLANRVDNLAILGRDALNQLRLTLNRPASTLELDLG